MKKKLSRIAAMLLAVVMVISGIAIMPMADVNAADKPSFTVKTDVTEMHPGDTVHVEFWLDEGADVIQFIGGFDFDTDVYTYVADSLQLNNDMVLGAIVNGGQAIVDQTDVYTVGGFSVLFDNMKEPFAGGQMIFSFDVTVNEDATESGFMGFNCVGCQTGTSDEDREDVGASDVISITEDANGNVISDGNIPVVIELEGLAIDQDDFTMAKGTTDKLSVTATPEAALAGKTVTWSSTDDSVVKVDQEGNIEAVSVGTATITASCEEFSDSVTITVNAPLTSITLNTQETSIKKGDTADLDVIYTPEDTSDDKTVIWTSSNDEIATVDENGVVTAVADGTATITATVGSLTAECIVHVREVPLEEIDLDKTAITMNKGDKSEALVVSYNPEDTTDDKTVTWSSDDEDIATVENGVVTAVGAGTTTITATVGEFTAECEVTVVSPLESITLTADRTTDDLEVNDTVNLTVVYNPEDTTDDKKVTWSSSDEDVATVDENGVVTGVAEGTATITATVKAGEGTTSASFNVTVNEIHVENAELADTTPSELYIGQAHDIQVVITPDNVTDEVTYTYASSDENVATVDENGTVNALAAGKTDITVTVKAGKFTKDLTFTLEVKEIPLESIAFKQEFTPLEEGQKAQLDIIFNPENTTVDRTVTWASSDESVATVDENGLLTAVKAGTTTISATVGDKEVSYELTVTEKKEPENPGSGDNNGQGGQTGNNGNNGQSTGDDGQNSGDKVNNQNNGGAVQTGDTTNIFGSVLTMLISLSVVALVIVFRSRGKRRLK